MSDAPVRFGAFELDLHTGELRKHGIRLRLQDQPFQVLQALVERPGEVVSREEIQRRIWTDNTFVDFDRSLNKAVNKVREALGDSAENPRYIETMARRGYRFIAPVEGLAPPTAVLDEVRPPKRVPLLGATLALVGLGVGLAAWLMPSAPPRLEWRRVTNDTSPKIGPVLSDGLRLYCITGGSDFRRILQVPVSGGEPSRLPFVMPTGPAFLLLDITADGEELLLRDSNAGSSEAYPLWTLRISDGSHRRVGSIHARTARYSPSGTQVAFCMGGKLTAGSLWVATSDGSNARRLLEVQGLEIFAPVWSADGRRIAFGRRNRATNESSTWDIGADGTGLRPLLPEFRRNNQPAGWSLDGGLLLLSEGQFWIANQRRFFQFKQPPPLQLSAADPRFDVPIQRASRTFFAVGTTPLGELQRLDASTRTWKPLLGGISAEEVEFSRDGQNVAYRSYPEGELWVRHADGSKPVQLTRAPMSVVLPRWSPDGKVLAFAGKARPDKPFEIHLVDAAGGAVRKACAKECLGTDLAWMPDGKKIVFAPATAAFQTEKFKLRLVDVATGDVTQFPGAEGLFSPRLSPDGSALLALVDGDLALYRFAEGTWKVHPSPISGQATWPAWSRDGQSIWYYDMKRYQIMRYHVRANRHEEISKLKLEEMAGFVGGFFNLTPNDEPMTLRRRDVQQIYALDLKTR